MMIPTPELVEQLRNLAGEKEEGRFTDAELEDIIKASDNIYAAASLCMDIKSGEDTRRVREHPKLFYWCRKLHL